MWLNLYFTIMHTQVDIISRRIFVDVRRIKVREKTKVKLTTGSSPLELRPLSWKRGDDKPSFQRFRAFDTEV